MSLASQRKEAQLHLEKARELLAHSPRLRKVGSIQAFISRIRLTRKKLWEAKYAFRSGQQ